MTITLSREQIVVSNLVKCFDGKYNFTNIYSHMLLREPLSLIQVSEHFSTTDIVYTNTQQAQWQAGDSQHVDTLWSGCEQTLLTLSSTAYIA